MDERDSLERLSALRPAAGKACIVMVCADAGEAEQVGRKLLEVNMGCLVTYRRAEELMYNTPTGEVVLAILATDDPPARIRRTLRWLRNHWPRCPLTVVGDAGCGEHEMAAREGGATYLTRPVAGHQWSALLGHVLRKVGRPEEADKTAP